MKFIATATLAALAVAAQGCAASQRTADEETTRPTAAAATTAVDATPAATAPAPVAEVAPASPPTTATPTPQDELKALMAEFKKAQQDFHAAYRAAKTDDERRKVQSEQAPKPDAWAVRFQALADKAPKDPAAANCLAWIAQNTRDRGMQKSALDRLLADHFESPSIRGVCQSLQYSQAPNADAFLRTVLDKSADHDAQGRACFTLAKRAATDAKESEALLERTAGDFGDLKYGRATLGDKAKADLFETRNLVVDKTAPEIVGVDENGKPMKLSDFRGKVVMLDFWGFW
jgi:hypothetical protein